MELVCFLILSFQLFVGLDAQSCITGTYLCDDKLWCCPDGYICAGSGSCRSIATIVGACIGSLIGLGVFVSCIYFLCCKQKQSVGTVIQPANQPVVYTTGQQQCGQPQYGQPAPSYGQPSYPPPASEVQKQ